MTTHQQNTLVAIAFVVGVFLLCGFLAALMGSHSGEVAGALGNVVGGAIGALGAAFAVYLTLKGQKEDETQKISTAIITEISQLARFPREQLTTCRAIFEGRLPLRRQDLRVVMQTPSPTLYLAAAELISRVHRPTLVIAFYIGLTETEKVVNVIISAPSGDVFLKSRDVRGLGVILINQCQLARQILSDAPIPFGTEESLVRQMLDVTVRQLDEELALAQAVFPTTEEYEAATEI